MINIETTINELGISAITAVELMEALSITPDELGFPQRFHRLQEVVGYLKQFPVDTQRFLIKKACYGKQVDKLDHMFEYTNLLKSKYELENSLKEIAAEKSAINMDMDMDQAMKLAIREKDVADKLSNVADECGIYER